MSARPTRRRRRPAHRRRTGRGARGREIGGGTIAWALEPASPLDAVEQARAIVDGTLLGELRRRPLEDAGRAPARRRRGSSSAAEGAVAAAATARRAGVAADWTNRCRDLVNAPANELTPPRARRAAPRRSRPSLPHLRFESLGPDEIRAAGMGAFAAVAQGSDTEPRLIVLDYDPPGARERHARSGSSARRSRSTAGGISLKPAERMDEMKCDMGGGAAVLCGLGAIAALGLPAARPRRRPGVREHAERPRHRGPATSSPR